MNISPAAPPMGPAPGSFRSAQEQGIYSPQELINIANYGNPTGMPGYGGGPMGSDLYGVGRGGDGWNYGGSATGVSRQGSHRNEPPESGSSKR